MATRCPPTAINDAGTIVGFGTTASGETHGFVWSKANGVVDIGTLGGDVSGLVEMPSLGRLQNVDAASRTGAFTGFTIDKKSLHAVLWVPSPSSSKQ